MTVIQTSQRELSRLGIMVEPEDGRLTVAAAAALMGIGQRQALLSPETKSHMFKSDLVVT